MTKVAFQGERGAYSEQALLGYFGERATPVAYPHLEDVFNALLQEQTAYGIVPIENSSAGSIYRTYDLMAENEVHIVGEYFQKINHCLVGLKGTSLATVKVVYSHSQALDQCQAFIKKHGLSENSFYDTAGAAKWVAQQEEASNCAIASALAAKVYGLDVLAQNIQTYPHNTTRFLVLSKAPSPSKGPCKTSLVFEARHIPAALYKCLGGFATNGVNLTKLESRPAQTGMGRYRFYLDCEGHHQEPAVDRALRELRFFTTQLRILGSYPAGRIPEERL